MILGNISRNDHLEDQRQEQSSLIDPPYAFGANSSRIDQVVAPLSHFDQLKVSQLIVLGFNEGNIVRAIRDHPEIDVVELLDFL